MSSVFFNVATSSVPKNRAWVDPRWSDTSVVVFVGASSLFAVKLLTRRRRTVLLPNDRAFWVVPASYALQISELRDHEHKWVNNIKYYIGKREYYNGRCHERFYLALTPKRLFLPSFREGVQKQKIFRNDIVSAWSFGTLLALKHTCHFTLMPANRVWALMRRANRSNLSSTMCKSAVAWSIWIWWLGVGRWSIQLAELDDSKLVELYEVCYRGAPF